MCPSKVFDSRRGGIQISGAVGQVTGDIIGGNKIGLNGEEVRELTRAAASGAVGPLAEKIVDLSRKLGVTQQAASAVLRTLGHEDIPVERLPDTLAEAAAQIVSMQQALSRLSGDDSNLAALKQQAASALDAGAFDDAKRILIVAREREHETSERRRQAAEKARADWLSGLKSEAETCVLLARTALLQRDVAAASAYLEDGLKALAPVDSEQRRTFALAAAGMMERFGERIGRNDALTSAITFYRLALADTQRERSPANWIATHVDLARALITLGNVQGQAPHLNEAVSILRTLMPQTGSDEHPTLAKKIQNDPRASILFLDSSNNYFRHMSRGSINLGTSRPRSLSGVQLIGNVRNSFLVTRCSFLASTQQRKNIL
jgi:hypothetical protein